MTEPVPIRKDGFPTCEENCTMKNPVPVRGMKGTLYDVQCRGDSDSYDYRMLIVEYQRGDGIDQAVAIGRYGPEQLEKCPE